MIGHLRKAFPKSVTAETVKRLGVAPNNESYVINALQYVGLVDEDGNKTEEAKQVFSNHKDEEFQKAFAGLVEKAYSDLFELYGERAWELESDDLITFFRSTDQTSDAIGKRQARTFQIFAGLAGHGELPAGRARTSSAQKDGSGKASKKKSASGKKTGAKASGAGETAQEEASGKDLGLSVRIEINLPSDGDKETYDNIFKSIKENLLD